MIFKILAEPDYFRFFLKKYNQRHQTEFEIIDIQYDEVTFISIESNNSTNNDIIKLGIQYAKSSIIEKIIN